MTPPSIPPQSLSLCPSPSQRCSLRPLQAVANAVAAVLLITVPVAPTGVSGGGGGGGNSWGPYRPRVRARRLRARPAIACACAAPASTCPRLPLWRECPTVGLRRRWGHRSSNLVLARSCAFPRNQPPPSTPPLCCRAGPRLSMPAALAAQPSTDPFSTTSTLRSSLSVPLRRCDSRGTR